jgi:hypothetical protein
MLRRLIEWADVVHHNMRPGAAERLGVGYEQVASINPDAVYTYAPGWGATRTLRRAAELRPAAVRIRGSRLRGRRPVQRAAVAGGQLLTWAGYDAEEITELRSRHVIG